MKQVMFGKTEEGSMKDLTYNEEEKLFTFKIGDDVMIGLESHDIVLLYEMLKEKVFNREDVENYLEVRNIEADEDFINEMVENFVVLRDKYEGSWGLDDIIDEAYECTVKDREIEERE